ncbi:YaiO family outer membrane beta-barrel protein [Aurantibacter crassamenti]|nr:YaiO family outer membrane beta-barrel protein [Aurantibacter crassamenti]
MALPISAQEVAYNGDPDRSFFVARDLAYEGHRTVARDTLTNILTKYPDYSDVRSLLASTHSWDGNYEIARVQFNKITSVDRLNKEAWLAAIKNELYAEESYLALGIANKALTYLPKDPHIAVLRDRALKDIESKQNEANAKLKEALAKTKETDILKNKISINNSFDSFDVVYDPMIYSSISYGRKTKIGDLITSLNYSNRFETHGLQYEVDFYPKFSETFYAYTNYGYSNSAIYPNHRVGAELYANLPKAIEASAGIRYINFDNADALIYTMSLGLYSGNYYFSLRPYVTPQDTGKYGVSGSFLARKYLKNADNYIGASFIMGYSPELEQLRDGETLLAETVLYIESQRLRLEYQFPGKVSSNIFRTNIGLTRQELIFDSDNYYWSFSAGLTCEVKF